MDFALVVIALDEAHQLCLSLNHEYFLRIDQRKAFVTTFSRPGDFESDCINELVYEEVVGFEWHILLLG